MINFNDIKLKLNNLTNNKYLNVLKLKFNSLTSNKYFDEVYAILIGLITLLGWGVNSILGMSLLIIVAAIALLLTEDFKYVIPSTIMMVFCINKGFSNDKAPVAIIVTGTIFVIILLIEAIRNGINIKRMKSSIGLIGLAVANIIPIFWSNNIPKENSIFYLFFFCNLAYLLLYVLFLNGIKRNSFNLLANTMTYLGIVLAIECMCKTIELHDTVDNVLKLSYYLGWGVCNEAGIMICMSIPFTFYLIGKSNNSKYIVLNHFKVLFMMVGVLLTTSRGALIFTNIEVIALFIALFFVSEEKESYRRIMKYYCGIGLVLMVVCCVPIYLLISDIVKYIFDTGLASSGRIDLWYEGLDVWLKNPLNVIFGGGMPAVLRETMTPIGSQVGMIVFHSTIVETYVIGGIVGMTFFCIHMIEKYHNTYKTNNMLLYVTMFIGFICVDLHGMIDNTYHMYYYMLPLMVILASIDNLNYNNENLTSLK